jgi:hypothetical protein
MVALADLVVSATEVAVTVTESAEAEGAGAVKVAAVVVVLESVPPPLTVQVTPALFWSLLTVALSVVVSPPSTVLAAAVTETFTAGALPPHPAIQIDATTPRHTTAHFFQNIIASVRQGALILPAV